MGITIKKRTPEPVVNAGIQKAAAEASTEAALKTAAAEAGHTVVQDTVLVNPAARMTFPIPRRVSEQIHSAKRMDFTVVVVPPKWRENSQQRTVIRFDRETKRYYVDEYWERCSPALVSSIIRDGYRPVRNIYCRTFSFDVALAVCHYYCAKPCEQHMEALANGGWYNLKPFLQKDAQLIPATSLRRRTQKEDEE